MYEAHFGAVLQDEEQLLIRIHALTYVYCNSPSRRQAPTDQFEHPCYLLSMSEVYGIGFKLGVPNRYS